MNASSSNNTTAVSEIENLIPWELDVMTSLLSNYLEQLEMQRKQAQNA